MSSSPINIAGDRKGSASGDSTPVGSPGSFLIPSPVPCKRTRTYSACERIAAGPSFVGEMKSFCREKGHGFILYEGEKLFCHISDIDGDYIPQAGDKVSFKKAAIPPKNEKFSAVHVTILELAQNEKKHETWDSPIQKN